MGWAWAVGCDHNELSSNLVACCLIYTMHSCPKCSRILARNRILQIHVLTRHLYLPSYSCPICDEPFVDRRKGDEHMKSIHLGEDASLILNVSRYRKDIASFLDSPPGPGTLPLITQQEMERSEKNRLFASRHIVRYYDNKCPECFKDCQLLRHHVAAVHLKLPFIGCSLCSYTCETKKQFQNHIEVHAGQRPRLQLQLENFEPVINQFFVDRFESEKLLSTEAVRSLQRSRTTESCGKTLPRMRYDLG